MACNIVPETTTISREPPRSESCTFMQNWDLGGVISVQHVSPKKQSSGMQRRAFPHSVVQFTGYC